MSQERRGFDVFAQPGFLVALIVLLVNDFYLKAHYANWLTGKLSDFAGLYVFAQFVATCFGGRIVSTAITSAILFAVWKSPMATPLIELVNRYSMLPVHRTIDYTDLIALAVLPLAVRCYGGRATLPWGLVKYPAAALAIIGIAATSSVPPLYLVRMNLHDRPNSEISIDPTYAEIDKLLVGRGMLCKACAAESPYREYFDSNEDIHVLLGYDKAGQTLFVSLWAESREAAKARTDELQGVLMPILRSRFETVAVVSEGFAYQATVPEKSIWELRIKAPSVGFPLWCTGNGVNNPEIAKAMTIIDESLRLSQAMDLENAGCYSMDARCGREMCRSATFGRVTGASLVNRSIRVSTHGFAGWGGTSLYVTVTEYGDPQGQGAAFSDELKKRLRDSLGGAVRIDVIKSREPGSER